MLISPSPTSLSQKVLREGKFLPPSELGGGGERKEKKKKEKEERKGKKNHPKSNQVFLKYFELNGPLHDHPVQ